MEFLNDLKFFNRITLLFLFVTFFSYGYSTPLDTHKKKKCYNGYVFQINGKEQCIDTTIMYYPNFTEYWEDFSQYYNMKKSINLQLLEEPKWYNEDIQEDRLRIFLMEYPPSCDSVLLYSFIKKDCNSIKLIKKEMFFYHYSGSYMPGSMNLFIDTEKELVANYKQTEFIIRKKKLQRLTKELQALKECETFDQYGPHPNFVIEYVCQGKYYLLIAQTPDLWVSPNCFEDKQLEKRCPRKSGFKIMEWLKQY